MSNLTGYKRETNPKIAGSIADPSRNVRRLGEKLAMFAGSGAVAAAITIAPTGANADIVQSQTTPIRPPTFAGLTNWDVDGDGTNDFRLTHFFSSSSDSSGSSINKAFFDDLNGGRLVVPAGASARGISKLFFGLTIGTGLSSPYKFHTAAQVSNSITYNGTIGSDAYGDWSVGDTGFFGFKFTNVSGTHFGWGEMSITGTPAGSGFIVNHAYYENTDGDISVGSVPEPSSVALLALGAAGLSTWRRRRHLN